jgi:glycosyltransferase involved in cell wall biosynthesis
MRVLMVTPSYYPIQGGTETVIRSFSIKLNEIGIHTDVMTFNMNRKWNPAWKGKTEKIDGINIFKIPALNWLPIIHSPRITLGVNLIPGRFTNRLKDYDIIHFHEAEFSFPLFSYLVQKPKILHLHGFILDYYKRYFFSRLILKHVADLYICLTKLMERELVELGLSEDKIRILPNSVDVKIFHPSEIREDNLVLFVGRICFEKGLHILLKSLRYLEKSIHLVIIGPPAWDHSYFEDILMSIEEENKKGKHRVTYLGAQDQTSITEWYKKASMLVLPSFREAFSVVALEASSCETPIVASNVGGIPEIIRDGENGILFPPADDVKLAEAIQCLLDDEKVRRKLGREGRKRVVEHFSLEAGAKRLCRIYKEMNDGLKFKPG